MKQLIVVRHAKSSWDMPGLRDHDRPLNDRGERDAPAMGAALKQRGIRPDIMTSSTALRARTTAEVIADTLGFPRENIVLDRDAFHASPQTLLGIVQQWDEGAETGMLFGHNPGMHDFSNSLSSDSYIEEFPTLAVARLELQVDYWGEADWSCGLLLELITPKMLQNDS